MSTDTFIPMPVAPGFRPPTVFLTRGPPASGKSTWARKMVEKYPDTVRAISMDDIRAALAFGHMHENKFSKAEEATVQHLQDLAVIEAVDAGFDVIVHNTHIFAKIPNRLRRLVALDARLVVVDFTDVSSRLCIDRNALRSGRECVPTEVIQRMDRDESKGRGGFKDYKTLTPVHAEFVMGDVLPVVVVHERVVRDPSLPSAAMVDLDGTLAAHVARGPYEADKCDTDALVAEVAMAASAFDHVILCSGREDTFEAITYEWLERTSIDAGLAAAVRARLLMAPLLMRKADDMRPDSIVKREIFETHIRGHYNVLAVFDDRDSVVRMWRKIGLPTWQVAPGRF